MVLKILRIIAVIVLAIMPFSTVLSGFSPYWVKEHTFQDFLLASLVFAIVSIFLGLFISKGRMLKNSGFLFFFLGLIIAPPLMIGPPEETQRLLERISEEHFRYGMLLIASLFFGVGFIMILKTLQKEKSNQHKLIYIPLIICFVLLIWDNFTSYNFSAELKDWISEGNRAEDFFPGYDFNVLIRTFGRSLIYILIIWLSVILFKSKLIKKWQAIFLCMFSTIGIIFFFLTNFVGMQFYFPFMVPAIALAPAFWLGLMLIVNKNP